MAQRYLLMRSSCGGFTLCARFHTAAHVYRYEYSTGYDNIRDVNKKLFGDDVIEQTGPVWGMDEEGEISGSYRPSGYPGVRSIF